MPTLTHRWILAALVVLATAGVVGAAPVGQRLVVEDARTGQQLLSVPVEEDTTVALVYNHSVEKTRVYDGYAVHDGELENTRMEFESYGWGLPAREAVRLENGTFVFDPEGSYEELYVKPGRIAGHVLVVGDRRYDLVALSDARSVRLTVTTRTPLDIALSRLT